MKGVLDVDQQLNVLSKIWGNDRDGYVFLPWIPGKAKDKADRRANYHEGPAFDWPKDRDKIKAWLVTHAADDVYFAPCIFLDKRRRENAADIERALWADLDEADPQSWEGTDDYRPTIAWESSPGRYQGIWLLVDGKPGLSWPGDVNHRLTMKLGADPSGWDTTQLLRVPGRPNHKPEYRNENGGAPVVGELLWDNGPRYQVADFDALPTVVTTDDSGADLMDEEIIDAVDRHEVWARVRRKVPNTIREYMGFRRPNQVTEEMDRSEIAWQIGKELSKAGCSIAEIIAVLRPTVWNSYAGRGDELKRLKVLASRVVVSAKDDVVDDGGALEILDPEKPDIRWLSDVMTTALRRPKWLIRDVWSDGGCGFIAGDPKSYKSWTGLDMAISVATGIPFLNDPQFSVPNGGRPVLYLQEEDSEIVVRDRLAFVVDGKCPDLHWHGYMTADAGGVWWSPADGNIPLGFHVRTGFIASDPGWQVWLADTIADGAFGHVIIDTLGTTAGDVDTDRAQDLMGKILKPLREISQVSGAGLTVVHHNRKNNGTGNDRAGMKMLGSVALHAWVDDAIYIHSREATKAGTTRVRVERESKASVEHRWVMEVPRMGVAPDGTRTVWSPVVGIWDTSEYTSDGAPVARGHISPQSKNVKPAGWWAGTQIKAMGAKVERPMSLADVAERMGKQPADAWKQISKGIQNGLIGGTREGGVWPITEALDKYATRPA